MKKSIHCIDKLTLVNYINVCKKCNIHELREILNDIIYNKSQHNTKLSRQEIFSINNLKESYHDNDSAIKEMINIYVRYESLKGGGITDIFKNKKFKDFLKSAGDVTKKAISSIGSTILTNVKENPESTIDIINTIVNLPLQVIIPQIKKKDEKLAEIIQNAFNDFFKILKNIVTENKLESNIQSGGAKLSDITKVLKSDAFKKVLNTTKDIAKETLKNIGNVLITSIQENPEEIVGIIKNMIDIPIQAVIDQIKKKDEKMASTLEKAFHDFYEMLIEIIKKYKKDKEKSNLQKGSGITNYNYTLYNMKLNENNIIEKYKFSI